MIHLHVHTKYSLLDSTMHIEDIAERSGLALGEVKAIENGDYQFLPSKKITGLSPTMFKKRLN